jgi:hypothetical protein
MEDMTWENCGKYLKDIIRSAENLAYNDIFEQVVLSELDEMYVHQLQKQLSVDIAQYRIYRVSSDLGQSLRKVDEVVCQYIRGDYLWLRQNNESQDFLADGVIQKSVFLEGRF